MKAILLSDIYDKPQLWHTLIPQGRLVGGVLVVEDALLAGVEVPFQEWGAPLPQARKAPTLDADARREVCAKCDWNQGWICEHIDCLPCKQRAAGGLLEHLKLLDATCPAGKWRANGVDTAAG